MRSGSSEFGLMLALLASACGATTAAAQTAVDPPNLRVTDIALQPLTELNLRHPRIAPILASAKTNPYTLDKLDSCTRIADEVSALDGVLGADIDTAEGKPVATRLANGAGRIARSMIMSFVPFHSILREVSGASARQHAFERTLYAGSARRAFLKGVGEERGCAYPARDATPEVAVLVRTARHTGQPLAPMLAALIPPAPLTPLAQAFVPEPRQQLVLSSRSMPPP